MEVKAAQRRCTQCIDNAAADFRRGGPRRDTGGNSICVPKSWWRGGGEAEAARVRQVTSEMIVQMTRALPSRRRETRSVAAGSPDPGAGAAGAAGGARSRVDPSPRGAGSGDETRTRR